MPIKMKLFSIINSFFENFIFDQIISHQKSFNWFKKLSDENETSMVQTTPKYGI